MLNRDAIQNRIAGLGIPANFYIRKAPAWKEPFYIMRYHPNANMRAQARFKIEQTVMRTASLIIEFCLIAVFAVS